MSEIKIQNMLEGIPAVLEEEWFQPLLATAGFRLERIVSRAHATPIGQWYDQENDEWVLLLSGSAGLLVENRSDEVVLKSGDSLHIPAGVKHRVEWTDAGQDTIWLALHYQAEKNAD